MGGEIDARRLKLLAERARIGIAGLEPVGDEDDGRLVLGIFERFGGLLDGGGQRRLAKEFQIVGGSGDGIRGAGGRRDDQLDVGAIALLAMAVSHEAEFEIGRHRLKHGVQRLAGDLQLRLAVDLAPHRA